MNENNTHPPKIVFLGTFPPTDEGIATFNDDLFSSIQKLLGKEAQCLVVAINLRDTSPYYFDSRVNWEIDQDSVDTYNKAVEDINADPDIKCVVIQHEYGLFGGTWGSYIADFMEKLKKPTLTILHSVLSEVSNNNAKFLEVTTKVVSNSSAIVVLSKKSKDILNELYPQSKDITYFIPHGIHPVKFVYPEGPKADLQLSGKLVLTTFGLLSPDKGIEYVLKALPKIIEKYPNVLYQVLGQTHPILRRLEGEKYRNTLVALTKKLKLRKNVSYLDKYMTVPELLKYLQGTDIYIASSVNKDQAVSGTFSYAVGTGRAVVSTEFVQSKEVINKKIGRLVPQRNPDAYAKAILDIMSDPKLLRRAHRMAYTKTRSMLWTNVAKNYIHIIRNMVDTGSQNMHLPKLDISYLKKMTSKHGILQFAKYDIPSTDYGYTMDDNARALIVTNWLMESYGNNKDIQRLHNLYFGFMKKSLKTNGEFINYFDHGFHPTDQNDMETPEEHHGRALWALSETIANNHLSKKTHNLAIKMWKLTIEQSAKFQFIRSQAFALKALCKVYDHTHIDKEKHLGLIHLMAEGIIKNYYEHDRKNWHWFENHFSYNNALIPESLVMAYKITKGKEYLRIARRSFAFFLSKTFMGEVYVPIGQNGWYIRGKKRSYFDQQPEDAGSTVLGLVTMFEVTKRLRYIKLAKHVFTWFLGNNLIGLPLYNYKTAGVYDGLHEDGINKNQGAESLVSYLLARIKIEKLY